MIFGHDYYHGTLRRYVIMFGNLFNELQVHRYNSAGQKVQTIAVPIAYGPKQKFVERQLSDPTGFKSVQESLPRLAFTMDSLMYAGQRKLNSTLKFKNVLNTNTKTATSVYSPVPYDMTFTLSLLTKNAEDGTQIVEQIIPFFTPDFTVTMKVLPEMNVVLDVPIELTNITSDDSYEGDFDTSRILSWDLTFTVKGYLFGPIQGDNKFIFDEEKVKVNVFNGFDATIPEFTIQAES